jgi:dolichol-phosphate mannosyltransferase
VERVSVVIPARDESGHLPDTLRDLERTLAQAGIAHEIVVVDDHSTDGSLKLLEGLREEIPSLVPVANRGRAGYGHAVVAGIDASSGDAVAVYMADGSDSPDDLVRFVRTMDEQGVDCVFGTRFSRGGKTVEYPLVKLLLNRAANNVIRALFRIGYDDVTNAFKLYRRETLDGLRPYLSHHFNLTVELPLKAIIRGYSYAVVPNAWINRREGVSKFQIKEMGSRYVFIVLYCWLERRLSRGDYVRK